MTKINKTHEYARSERVNWLDEFADKLAQQEPKSAVEVARQRANVSIYDQINSIMNHPTYKTVDGVVQEYRERTGLNEYLKRVSEEKQNTKYASQASSLDKFGPQLKEDIINFISNTVENHHGHITIPAVQHDVLSMFEQYGVSAEDINTEDVSQLINNLVIEYQSNNPTHNFNSHNLGKGVGLETEDENSSEDFLPSITNKL